MTFRVVRKTTMTIGRGYGDLCDVLAQVTHIELGRLTGYVRENRRASGLEHFVLSSGARLGNKADGDRIGQNVLELAAERGWDTLARAVATADHLNRPVVRSRRWSVAAAQAVFDAQDENEWDRMPA